MSFKHLQCECIFLKKCKKTQKIERLGSFYSNVFKRIGRMDLAFEGYMAQNNSAEPDDIPKTNDPVWILGHSYNAIQGR